MMMMAMMSVPVRALFSYHLTGSMNKDKHVNLNKDGLQYAKIPTKSWVEIISLRVQNVQPERLATVHKPDVQAVNSAVIQVHR